MSTDPQAMSRWTVMLDRWKEGGERQEPPFARFKASFDAFSRWSDRRVNPLLLVALAVALIAAATLIVYGVMWGINQPKLYLFYLLLKSAKWMAIGLALVAALALRNWVMSKPADGDAAEPASK